MMNKRSKKAMILRLTALAMVLLLLPAFALAEEEAKSSDDWVTFFLMCNEGMTNDGSNVGNTIMLVSMNPNSGKIRLMMFAWDTFVQYEGYDVPQLIGMPYRNVGPEGTMEVFNKNFGLDVNHFISLNYLNLATLIDDFGGVNADVTRAERNALNGMVDSKKWALQKQADSGLLSQLVVEMLAKEYYLNDYGPDTHLNGLQAVGYGWLQYDSVYNCCLREVEINANLFASVSTMIGDRVIFYDDDAEDIPETDDDRRIINLDQLTDEDIAYLLEQVEPIFQRSYNNMTEDEIIGIGLTLARISYESSRQGVDIFTGLATEVFPLEARDEYDVVAGTQGHLVDYEANGAAMKAFLFAEEDED